MHDQPPETAEPEDRLGMTEEQWERFQAYTHGFGEQDENGVDVSLLRENLKLTPGQRVEQMLRRSPYRWRKGSPGAEPDCRRLLAALQESGARFLLIGHWARWCYGAETLTQDIDLHYVRDMSTIESLVSALTPFQPRLRGLPHEFPYRWHARTVQAGPNHFLMTDAGPVDLIANLPGVDAFEALWKRSQEIEVVGVLVRVACIDDLIAMERVAGHPLAMLRLSELERLRAA
jgi:predicted nucleotidyltransferase